MLEEPGESNLLGKLKQHQLQQEDGAELRKHPRQTTDWSGECLRAIDRE
jgi:hypothetical protein